MGIKTQVVFDSSNGQIRSSSSVWTMNPITGEFVIGPQRVGHINGHEIHWTDTDDKYGERVKVSCDHCEEGVKIPFNENAMKYIHGYFYKNECDGDVPIVNGGVSSVRNP